ncbi:MAG: ABC transporter ATP-binding protein [Planctomycetota bacterium]|nr:MAG: ABC transporter ATP-binding protein [Planctomycetota bacterium]
MRTASNSEVRQPLVKAEGLVKVFGDFWMRAKARAVDNIDFEIFPNEIFGLLGPNGSGKSTTIKLILGLLRKSKGKLTVFGQDPANVSVKARIGYLPEESYMYRFLNPVETLDYYGKLFGLPKKVRRSRTDELLEMVGLEGASQRAVGEFSKGMARRLGLAQALINDPELLILDEPTSGLDPIGTRQVKDLLLDLRRRGKTILLSSHLLADVEDVCDRMVVLYGGKIRAEGTATELLSDTQRTTISTARLKPETIEKVDALLLKEEGFAIEHVDSPRQKLEDLFIQIVERARAEQTATSGANQGGKTATFLMETQAVLTAESSSVLIEDLQRSMPINRVIEPIVKADQAKKKAEPDFFGELLTPTPSVQHVKPPSPPEPTEAIDRSVIDGLIDGDSKKKG